MDDREVVAFGVALLYLRKCRPRHPIWVHEILQGRELWLDAGAVAEWWAIPVISHRPSLIDPYTGTGSNRRGPGVLLQLWSTFPAPSQKECLVGTKNNAGWSLGPTWPREERDIPIGYHIASPSFPPRRVIAHYIKLEDFKLFLFLLIRLFHFSLLLCLAPNRKWMTSGIIFLFMRLWSERTFRVKLLCSGTLVWCHCTFHC